MWTNALMSKCVRFFFRMCNVLVHAYLCIHIYTSLCTFAGVSSFCASKCSANLWICVDVHSFTIFLNCETSLSVRPCIFFHIYIYTQALGNTLLFKLIWQSTRKEICREAKRCIISDKGFLSEWKHVRLLSIFHDFGPCGNHLFVQQWSGSLLEFFSIVFGMPWANSPNHRKLPK